MLRIPLQWGLVTESCELIKLFDSAFVPGSELLLDFVLWTRSYVWSTRVVKDGYYGANLIYPRLYQLLHPQLCVLEWERPAEFGPLWLY
jgi:hypothetical protein